MRTRIAFLLFMLPGFMLAQSTNATLNEDYYHWVDRYEIKAGRVAPELFTTVKPYKRNQIIAYVDSLHARDGAFATHPGGDIFSKSDAYNQEYLRNDSWEWSHSMYSDSKKPIWNTFYKKKSDLY